MKGNAGQTGGPLPQTSRNKKRFSQKVFARQRRKRELLSGNVNASGTNSHAATYVCPSPTKAIGVCVSFLQNPVLE